MRLDIILECQSLIFWNNPKLIRWLNDNQLIQEGLRIKYVIMLTHGKLQKLTFKDLRQIKIPAMKQRILDHLAFRGPIPLMLPVFRHKDITYPVLFCYFHGLDRCNNNSNKLF